MKKFIVLFKGINVGGNNLMPMKLLVPVLQKSGFEQVSSYIQSGNVVLASPDNPTDRIKTLVADHFDLSPELITLDAMAFEQMVIENPFKAHEGKFVHFYFCKHDIELVTDKLEKYIAPSESYIIQGQVFYLHAPEGIGRSKLVANVENCLGQSATGRNLNTVNKIAAMLLK